ncbi:pentapeptide repeat-containing protein [Pleurocapsales cyanobacterium LEGE 06147]|nr:pentapeptide repeat-containing protein [Pleurocapsales cyanobacterium LEGE 06147]
MTNQSSSTPNSESNQIEEQQNSSNGKTQAESSQSPSSLAKTEQDKSSTVTASRSMSRTVSIQNYNNRFNLSQSSLIIIALIVMGLGLWFNLFWVGIAGAIAALLFSLGVVVNSIQSWLGKFFTSRERKSLLAFIGFTAALAVLFKYLGVYRVISNWLTQFKYDEFGSWAEWVGALGQISIAILAVYVAWAQYVISRDLTIQQNTITQQQTIDAYFQGISDLALNDEGFLEDWPQERAFAEGRTAAILSGVDAAGKAKILRFLSQSRLLTPLKRDYHLGRPILDGSGGYEEDRMYGLRVIDLGPMLVGAYLVGQDLRWTDLSEAYMMRANLSRCDLAKANLSRTVLQDANLTGADLRGTHLFYGSAQTASPRSRNQPPDYVTGEHTGAVIERANFTQVRQLSEEQRYYLCAWGGEKTRGTIPGGCEDVPNKLGR